MKIAPWGVVLLVLFGLESLALNVTGGLLMWEARREIRAAQRVSATAAAVLDTLTNAPYQLTPRDTLRRRTGR